MDDLIRLALLAFPAGLLGFASAPCCGLLAPAYFPYILGSIETTSRLAKVPAGGGAERALVQKRAFRSSMMFMLGFVIFFTGLGASASAIGTLFLEQLPLLEKFAGGFMIVMGIALLAQLRILLPRTNTCLDLSSLPSTSVAALGMGVAFAVSWTPCTGPVLGSILAGAATTETVWEGTTLLFIYSLGLALPFVLMGFAYVRGRGALTFVRGPSRWVERSGGAFMVAVGILILVGGWQAYLGPATRWLVRHGWPPI